MMKKVTWIIHNQTVVDTDDDKVAQEEVEKFFKSREWTTTGKCVKTEQFINILSCDDASNPF